MLIFCFLGIILGTEAEYRFKGVTIQPGFNRDEISVSGLETLQNLRDSETINEIRNGISSVYSTGWGSGGHANRENRYRKVRFVSGDLTESFLNRVKYQNLENIVGAKAQMVEESSNSSEEKAEYPQYKGSGPIPEEIRASVLSCWNDREMKREEIADMHNLTVEQIEVLTK